MEKSNNNGKLDNSNKTSKLLIPGSLVIHYLLAGKQTLKQNCPLIFLIRSENLVCIFGLTFIVWRKQSSNIANGNILPLRDTHSLRWQRRDKAKFIQESTGVESSQWCGEVLHWEKTFYDSALHRYLLLHHPMVKFALQKYLKVGLNIKRVVLPCRDIWWGHSGRAGKENVRFIKL